MTQNKVPYPCTETFGTTQNDSLGDDSQAFLPLFNSLLGLFLRRFFLRGVFRPRVIGLGFDDSFGFLGVIFFGIPVFFFDFDGFRFLLFCRRFLDILGFLDFERLIYGLFIYCRCCFSNSGLIQSISFSNAQLLNN